MAGSLRLDALRTISGIPKIASDHWPAATGGQGERSQGDQQGTRDPFSVAACPQVQSYGAYSGQKRYTDPDPNVQFALMRQAARDARASYQGDNHEHASHGSQGWKRGCAAGNCRRQWLLDRRALLGRGIALAGAVGTGVGTSLTAAAEPLSNGPWSLAPGVPIPPYGQPSKFEQKVVRTLSNPKLEPRGSAARTPHHLLNGTITPNGLHFVIARGGETEVDPDRHRLLIHGLVREPMVYTLDALHRYPMVSRISFVECGGNSAPLYSKEPIQANVQALHGLCSCAEWTGVMLSTLFEEVGIDPKAKWFIAEGADLPTINRSIPLAKALDDAMIALYQNGERLNPANGYPLRLLLPGYEGNMNVKWLRRIKLVESPVMAINEISSTRSCGRTEKLGNSTSRRR